MIQTSSLLALHDANFKTKIGADVSAFGLVGVLLQYHSSREWKPIAYGEGHLQNPNMIVAEREGSIATLRECGHVRSFQITSLESGSKLKLTISPWSLC